MGVWHFCGLLLLGSCPCGVLALSARSRHADAPAQDAAASGNQKGSMRGKEMEDPSAGRTVGESPSCCSELLHR